MNEAERLAFRFQNQPWHVKLWRLRWYLTIPHRAIRCWVFQRRDESALSFRECWGLAAGLAQIPMEWWFTTEEIDERLGRDKA